MKVASIGNITFDILAYTDTFPKEDTRNQINSVISGFGGPAANASYVMAQNGIGVDFYGIIGNDIYGKMIYGENTPINLNLSTILVKEDFKTPLSYILIAKDTNTRTINTCRDEKEKQCEQEISFKDYKYDVIYTDGKYPNKFKELASINPNAIKIIDAGRCTKEIIELCKEMDYVICSEDFAKGVIKALNYNENLTDQEMFKVVNEYYKSANVIITLGPKGSIYEFNGEIKIIAPIVKNCDVVETNAAGDIYHGAFTTALIYGMNYEEAITFANITSSISVTRYGGKLSCPTYDEVMEELNEEKEKTKRLIK